MISNASLGDDAVTLSSSRFVPSMTLARISASISSTPSFSHRISFIAELSMIFWNVVAVALALLRVVYDADVFFVCTTNVADVVYSGIYLRLSAIYAIIAAASAPSRIAHQFTKMSWISVNGSIL